MSDEIKSPISWLKITNVLGKGAQGAVYLTETKEGDQFVLKTMKIEQTDYILNEANVLQEIEPVCRPYLTCLTFFTISEDSKTAYFVYEYVPFTRELGYLYQDVDFDIHTNYIMIENLLLGLTQMHRMDVVHRDIKPGNILMNPVTLVTNYIDFGFACGNRFRKECFQRKVGTPRFIAPELLIEKNFTLEMLKKADIWALGITLMLMCMRSLPSRYMGITTWPEMSKAIKSLTDAEIDADFKKLEGESPANAFYAKLIRPMLIIDWKKRISTTDALKLLYQMANIILPDVNPEKSVRKIDEIAHKLSKSFTIPKTLKMPKENILNRSTVL